MIIIWTMWNGCYVLCVVGKHGLGFVKILSYTIFHYFARDVKVKPLLMSNN